MATPGPSDDTSYQHLRSHEQMWGTFTRVSKWIVIGTVILLILMAGLLTGDHRGAG